MRSAIAATVLAGALAVSSSPAAATTGTSLPGADPTPAQIRTSIARATSAKTLWATVNICDTRTQPRVLGIRGQMPSLGFASWLSMEINLSYYDQAKQAFVADPGTAKTIRLGRSTHGLQQGGATYTFMGPTPMLQASVSFTGGARGTRSARRTWLAPAVIPARTSAARRGSAPPAAGSADHPPASAPRTAGDRW